MLATTPDSAAAPHPKDPQLLNRYAYTRNNPLRPVDPTGHMYDSPGGLSNPGWDPTWVQQFKQAHGGADPTLKDWDDYQSSLSHPDSGSTASDIIEHVTGGPDYSSATYSVTIPYTGVLNVGVQVALDHENQVYLGVVGGVAAGPPVTRQLTQSWVLQPARPKPEYVHDFITGPSVSAFGGTGRFGVGLTLGNVKPPTQIHPNDLSVDAGYSPRQLSMAYSYTWDMAQVRAFAQQVGRWVADNWADTPILQFVP